MNKNLNDKERELVKLVTFFKKRAEGLMKEGKLSAEHNQVITACESLVEKLQANAVTRAHIMEQRETLSKMIKDNAECPKCYKNTHLKHVGVITNAKGWKCNSYKCRRCNIQFDWSRPNNAWDMILFMEDLESTLTRVMEDETIPAEIKQQSSEILVQILPNLTRLKPIIEASDLEYTEMKTREPEMAKMIHDFKNYLLIEKIKMDSWNDTVAES